MTDATFTFRIDAKLKEAFIEMADERYESAAQMLRGLMRAAVTEHREIAAHERWLRREISATMKEVDETSGDLTSGDVASEAWLSQRAEIDRRDDT